LPEAPRATDWEADARLVDADGVVARATGANGSRPVAGPGVASVAAAFPEVIVDNESIAGPLGVDSDWIASRTGVRERRMATDESLVDLATAAGVRALELSGAESADVDLLLLATCTQDALLPHAAPLVADRLGADMAGALDLGAACTGFLAGLSLATAQLESGRARTVLVIGAEVLSRIVDYTDRRTAGLFGDAAGAAVLTAGGPGRIGGIVLRSDGSRGELITAAHEERLLRMDGRATFRAAVAALEAVSVEALSDAGLATEEIDLFVYHQANSRIISAVGERLGLPEERVVDCIETFGNTSAASIPVALSQAASDGRLAPGSRVLVGAFGAGLTWGAGIIEWGGQA
jgi:3-oxoacyl-[acyl-carrier-protein] synthase III